MPSRSIWRTHGARVMGTPMHRVEASEVDGVSTANAINFAKVGAKALSGGAVQLAPGVCTPPHHHDASETVMFVTRGRLRVRWGDSLEFGSEATGGDIVFIPPFVPHQEINVSEDQPAEYIGIRTGGETPHVSLDIVPSEEWEEMRFNDDPNQPAVRAAMVRGLSVAR